MRVHTHIHKHVVSYATYYPLVAYLSNYDRHNNLSTSIPALYQRSAQNISTFHSITTEGCSNLPESKENGLLPALLKYEAVYVSFMYTYMKQSEKPKKSKFCSKKIWSKDQL